MRTLRTSPKKSRHVCGAAVKKAMPPRHASHRPRPQKRREVKQSKAERSQGAIGSAMAPHCKHAGTKDAAQECNQHHKTQRPPWKKDGLGGERGVKVRVIKEKDFGELSQTLEEILELRRNSALLCLECNKIVINLDANLRSCIHLALQDIVKLQVGWKIRE